MTLALLPLAALGFFFAPWMLTAAATVFAIAVWLIQQRKTETVRG